MKVLDTTVAVDYLRGRPEAVHLLGELTASGEMLVASELVRYEILAGTRSGEREGVEDFLAGLGWIDVTSDVARLAAELFQTYRTSHASIDDVDYLIAATAVIVDKPLLTTNVRHFPMFKDLRPAYRTRGSAT